MAFATSLRAATNARCPPSGAVKLFTFPDHEPGSFREREICYYSRDRHAGPLPH
jgi:hypothetical protein